MSKRLFVTSASNTLAAALSTLRQSGYTVTLTTEGYRAENASASLLAEDLLQLLGLARLLEVRGVAWPPTDEEVQAVLDLEGEV